MPTIARVRALRQEYEQLAQTLKSLPAPVVPTSGGSAAGPRGGADALRRNTPAMADLISELDKRYGRR